MGKVYIVTSGEYSDYHIEAVFTSYEEANSYVKKFNTDYCSYDIEEWMVGNDYLKEFYWQFQSFITCTTSFKVLCASSKVESLSGGDVRFYRNTRAFHYYYDHGVVFSLMIILPKNRFTTEQEVKEHYEKVAQDYVAKVKYMIQVDKIDIGEAVELMGDRLYDAEEG